jgi:hypothetical protein
MTITVDIGTDTDGDLNNTQLKADLLMDVYSDSGLSTEKVYIRDVTTGDYLYTRDTVPSSVLGDNQTVRAAGVTTILSSTPVSGQVVKGAGNVEAIGIILSATDASAITVRQMQVKVFVNTSSTVASFPAAAESTTPRDSITQIKLYDGTTLLSAKTLSNVTSAHDYGLATFDGLNIVVDKGSTKKLVVKADVSSSITAAQKFAVEIPSAGITAYDADSNLLTVSTEVNTVTAGTIPSVYTTVLTGGSLTIVRDAASPVSGIVLAGTTGNTVSKFKFTAANEAFVVNKLQVDLSTTASEGSITKVTASWPGGNKEGYLSQSAGTSSVTFMSLGWAIAKDTSAVLDIKVDTKAVDQNQTETGRVIRADLDYYYNFEAVGESQTVKTAIDSASANVQGYAMYLRKAKPTITTTAYSAALMNQEVGLYQFSVKAEQEPITLKQLGFDLTVYQGTTGTTTIGSLSFWKGSSQYTASDVNIQAFAVAPASMATTTTGVTTAVSNSVLILVGFKNDKEVEIAAGETVTFTLKGVVSGIDQTGDSISIRLASEVAGSSDVTGYVLRDGSSIPLSVGTGTNLGVYYNFIWSDKAKGVGHTSTEGATSGSLDWANGLYPMQLAGSYWTFTK